MISFISKHLAKGILLLVTANLAAAAADDEFETKIRPIFNSRCVACHSCADSPCQLNLQSADGVQRGAALANLLDASRLKPVKPTRINEDAQTVAQWRAMGFHDVLAGGDRAIMARILNLAGKRSAPPKLPVSEQLTCVADDKSMSDLERNSPELAMPYGLPKIFDSEAETVNSWLANLKSLGEMSHLGLNKMPSAARAEARRWEAFLNKKDLRRRTLARYLYEHFFLARFHHPSAPDRFMKLTRSAQECSTGVVPVQARRPNSDPGVPSWNYCFYEDSSTPVYKTHIPYELSDAKLTWIHRHFASIAWNPTVFPSFDPAVAANPMQAFREIPASLRYRFLLEDARYHLMTFIKGPVCNGNIAVNVIQEQFYIFFTDPSADLTATVPEFAGQSERLLALPASFGGEGAPLKVLSQFKEMTELRNQYRTLRDRSAAAQKPQGPGLTSVWDGDGRNLNALLTVFRHGDNADVQLGARGDAPKTAFLLDYALFERLVYDLVVNFDPSGDVKHQMLTRLYMDLLRMEAERNYIYLLPPQERVPRMKSWYVGTLAELKIDALGDGAFAPTPTRIQYGDGDLHLQLLQQLIFKRLANQARATPDLINWKVLRDVSMPAADALDAQLRRLASVKAIEASPFARFFPELSALYVMGVSGDSRIYSIAHNREHQNVAWMFGEEHRLSPNEDSLTIEHGPLGGYINQIYFINENRLSQFVDEAVSIHSLEEFRTFNRHYGTPRMDPAFWTRYDALSDGIRRATGSNWGYLDLSRYEMSR